jgi:hypothetical protein
MLKQAQGWPGFRAIWNRLRDDPNLMMLAERIVPIEVLMPGHDTPLRFRLVLIYLSLDPRFQIIAWIPFGAHSMRAMARWAEEEGER